MDLVDLIWHVGGFLLPALFVSATVVLSSRWLRGSVRTLSPWWLQFAVNALVGVGVLLAGLVLTGQDGRMLSYGGLVLAIASCQYLLWRV